MPIRRPASAILLALSTFLILDLVYGLQTSAAQAVSSGEIADVAAAYPENGFIRFDPAVEPDWEAAARRSLSDIDLDAPDPVAVKASGDYMWGSVEVEFPLEVPAALQERRHYLLSPDGAVELEISGLIGVARFDLDRDGKAIRSVSYYGYARAAVPGSLEEFDGGFVLTSTEPLTLSAEPVTLPSDELARAQTGTPAPESYYAQGTQFWNVLQQVAFRLGQEGSSYLLVRWAADEEGREGFCEFRFALFELVAEPRLLETLNHGCDV